MDAVSNLGGRPEFVMYDWRLQCDCGSRTVRATAKQMNRWVAEQKIVCAE